MKTVIPEAAIGLGVFVSLIVVSLIVAGCQSEPKPKPEDDSIWNIEHHDPEVNPEKLLHQVGRIGSHNAMIIIGLMKFDQTGDAKDIPMKQIGEHLSAINKTVNEMEDDLGEYTIQSLKKGKK